MLNSVPFYIGLRYIGSKRRNGFLAFVSIFALLGMVLGVFALIVVLSVMNGFDRELKGRILRVVPHAFIYQNHGMTDWQSLKTEVSGFEGVVASSPYISGKGLVAFNRGVRGVELQGVLPEHEKQVSVVADHMMLGNLEDLRKGEYNIVIGSLMARYLGVTLGDKISITLPMVSVSPAGVFPRSKRFTVVGVFEVGAQQDETLSLIHIADAQKLFRYGNKVDGLRIKYTDLYAAPQFNLALKERFDGQYEVKDWSETQGNLFQAVKMEKTVVGVMLSIIIAVAAFNIVTSLVMMVTEKRGDIAVLRTMGLSPFGVVRIFVIQGTLLGVLGVCVGAVSGIVTAHYLSSIIASLENALGIYIFDPNVYFVSYLPSVWQFSDTVWVCALAVTLSFLSTIYPAYRASKISPAEALRYDT